MIRVLTRSLAFAIIASSASALQCTPERWEHLGADSGDRLGVEVAIDGDIAVVGELFGGGLGTNWDDIGAVQVFRRDSGNWSHETEISIVAFDHDMFFGAALDLQGDLLAVGAQRQAGPHSESGALYLFEFAQGQWSQTAMLQPQVMSHGERRFGNEVDIEGDRMIVGAFAYHGMEDEAGAVFIFDLVAGVWTETAKLTASDGVQHDWFGCSVVLHGDTAFIGAYHNDAMANRSGAVYVFEKSEAGWIEVQKVAPSSLVEWSTFGFDMVLEGSTLFVGAPRQVLGGTVASGAVYTYELVDGTLIEAQRIEPTQPSGADQFGFSIAASGSRVLIGSPSDASGAQALGYVEAFRLVQGIWVPDGKLWGQDPEGRFGSSIAMSSDATVIGAVEEDGALPGTGAVYFTHPILEGASRYCVGAPNSMGPGAVIDFAGSLSLTEDDLLLNCAGMIPGQYALFIYGPEETQNPFGAGFLCIGPGTVGVTFLYPTTLVGKSGSIEFRVQLSERPFTSGPGQVLPGSTWHFQSIYRDPGGAGASWNLSDAMSLRFCR